MYNTPVDNMNDQELMGKIPSWIATTSCIAFSVILSLSVYYTLVYKPAHLYRGRIIPSGGGSSIFVVPSNTVHRISGRTRVLLIVSVDDGHSLEIEGRIDSLYHKGNDSCWLLRSNSFHRVPPGRSYAAVIHVWGTPFLQKIFSFRNHKQ